MAQIHAPALEIRAELAARVDALRARAAYAKPNEIAIELEAVRRLARSHRNQPAVTVVHAIDSALARGEHGALVQGWLAILRDAVDTDSVDEDAQTLFAAACSVRLAG